MELGPGLAVVEVVEVAEAAEAVEDGRQKAVLKTTVPQVLSVFDSTTI